MKKQFGKFLLFLVVTLFFNDLWASNITITPYKTRTLLNSLYYYDSIQNLDSLNKFIRHSEELLRDVTANSKINEKVAEDVADIFLFLAEDRMEKGMSLTAISLYNKAESFYNVKSNLRKVAYCLYKKGDIYLGLNNQLKALENYYRSTILYEDLNDSTEMTKVYLNLAKIYKEQDDYLLAKENISKALSINYQLENPLLLSQLKKVYAEIIYETGKVDEALLLFQESLSLAKIAGDKHIISQVLNKIGNLYLSSKDYNQAKYFFDEALRMALENDFKNEEANAIVNIGRYYFLTDKLSKAIEYGLQAAKLYESINSNNTSTRAIVLLSEVYQKQGDWKNAFFYQDKLINIKEKKEKEIIEQTLRQEAFRLAVEKDKLLMEQKKVEETLRSEKDIQRRNVLLLIVGVIVILLIFSLLIVYLRLKAINEKNKIISKQNEERKMLLQEVHHRVKNNFQIVSSMLRLQSYGFENEELRQNFTEAVNRINSMAIVHEVIYQQERFKDINSKVYLEKLIEVLEKTGDKSVSFESESDDVMFRIETLISLGIALNELITNSFKHAFNDKIENPKIKISLRAIADNKFTLTYQDNGIGINKKKLQSNFGMELIETIVDNYDGVINIISTIPKWPTTIEITFNE